MSNDWTSYISMGKDAAQIIKTMSETVKSLWELRSAGKADSAQLFDATVETLRDQISQLQQKHFELQNVAFSLSQENLAMAQSYRSVLDELAELKKFDASRDLFERVTLALNTSAYREKTFEGPADSQPLFCPQCFDNGKKTYLSFHEHAMHTKHMKCSACSSSVHIARNDGPAVRFGRVNRRDIFDD